MAMTIKWHGDKAKAVAKQGAARGLKQAADYVLGASKAITPVAPIAGGPLRDSGVASVDECALRAAVSYGFGPTARYAVWVHENMTDHHTTGQSKYLEVPLTAARGEVRNIIAREIKQELGA